MEATLPTETVFYKDFNVTVTQSRFVTDSKTYAMRNISSVYIYEIEKSRTFPVILVIIGFLMLFGEDVRIMGICMLTVGCLLLYTIKNEFAVRISTNSGEANSLVSKDRAYIQKIVGALNEAIIHRG